MSKYFLIAPLLLLVSFACKNKNRIYTADDVIKDTLTEAHTFSNSIEVEERNNQLFMKYVYTNNSNEGALYWMFGLAIGNIERYIHGAFPESRSHKLNEAPAVYGSRWAQIEPLYLKLLSAIRTALKDHPSSSTLYEHSADVKCTINDLKGAIADMLMAIRLNPTSSKCHELLGYYYELDNDLPKACEYLRKARDLGAEIRQADILEVCDK